MTTITTSYSTEHLPLASVLGLQPVVSDYLNEKPEVRHLVSDFLNLEAVGHQIDRKKQVPVQRAILVSALQKQYDHTLIKPEAAANIKLLNSPSTFTITTAHQTNLLGGPLYFIQKAISAVNAAKKCKAEYPEYDFVPIYWLGSEDHDFDELNHIHLFGKSVKWNDEQGGAVGEYSTGSLGDVLILVEELLGSSVDAIALKELVSKAYKEQPTITKATRVLINEILGELGVVVVDGNDPLLKEQMVAIFKRDIEEHTVSQAIQESLDFIHQHYGSSQAHPRDINLFYLRPGLRGRIVSSGDEFTVLGSNHIFAKETLIKELEEHPERFSPNVMLRPVMQEVCLPNIMYVGGGGESAYWLQLKAVFDAFGIPFPLIALRDTAVYVDSKTQKQLEQLGLKVGDVFVPQHSLVQSYVSKHSMNELSLNDLKSEAKEIMTKMQEMAGTIDSTLKASAGAEAQRIQRALSNLEKKMLRAEKKNHSIALRRIANIYENIHPQGKLQERYDNFLMYQLKYGDNWLKWMLNSFDLFDKTVKVMIEK